MDVLLRSTTAGDVEFVRELEGRPENRDFIGSWSAAEHLDAIAHEQSEHWVIEDSRSGERLGFVIAFDGRAEGRGVYLKRIATSEPGRGVGRAALERFLAHVFDELAASQVSLTVVPTNHVARHLYDSLGFVPADEPLPNGNRGMTLAAAVYAAPA